MRRESVAVLLVGLILVGCSGQDQTSPDPEPTPVTDAVLLVGKPRALLMEAIVAGTLELNESGCYTLAGAVLVAPDGSTGKADGSGVRIAGMGRFVVGEEIKGSGGFHDGPPPDLLITDPKCESSDTEYAILQPQKQ